MFIFSQCVSTVHMPISDPLTSSWPDLEVAGTRTYANRSVAFNWVCFWCKPFVPLLIILDVISSGALLARHGNTWHHYY